MFAGPETGDELPDSLLETRNGFAAGSDEPVESDQGVPSGPVAVDPTSALELAEVDLAKP
jgi:hypothetical protein